MEKDLILYILCLTKDMPSMGRGKTVAHGAHAANLFTWNTVVKPLLNGQKPDEDVMEWHQMANGFGTTVALDVGSLEDMIKVTNAVATFDHYAGIVVDPTYPYLVDREIVKLIDPKIHTLDPIPAGPNMVCFREAQTCAYAFGEKELLKPILSKFNLLPND